MKCIDEEIPFELPNGWEWCRLKNIVDIKGGKRLPIGCKLIDEKTSHIYIRVSDMQNGTIVDSDLKYITEDVYELIKNYTISKNDLYLTIVGSTIGKAGYVPRMFDNMNLTENAVKFTNIPINKDFLLFYIQSEYAQLQFRDKTKQVGQPKLAIFRIENTLIPIPPILEQGKIVEQIRNVLLLVDNYSKYQDELNSLNLSINELLKKSILQEAIQGKLVEQCSKDEPASVLLQRIKAEKERLIKEKKIKRDKQESIIYKGDDNSYFEKLMDGSEICIDEEVPFDLPESWNWVRLGCLAQLTIGKTPPRGEVQYWTNGCYNWVSISDMTDYGFISKTKEKVSEIAAKSAFGKISPKGALLMSFKLTVGRTSILNIDAYHNEAIITINPFIDDEFALRDYLFWVLPLISIYGDSKDAIKGKTLNSKSLYNLLIPLPLEKPRDFDPFGQNSIDHLVHLLL